MREDLLKRVAGKEALAIPTDLLGNAIWESGKNPVAIMHGQYLEHQSSGVKAIVLYANQVGIAMGIMAGRTPIREYRGVRVSESGLKMFKEMGMVVIYAELIPLVKSSKDDTKICPIKQFLYDHRDQEEQWGSPEECFRKNWKFGTEGA